MKTFYFLVMVLIILMSCKERNPNQPAETLEESLPSTLEPPNPVKDLIMVQHPKPNQLISSPLLLKGMARGTWFFEADAQVELIDNALNPVSQSYITAVENWMTQDWVNFQGTIEFTPPGTDYGYLIFHKANPSGMQERALSDTLKVRFY